MTEENERQQQKALLNKTPQDKGFDREQQTMKSHMKHVLFQGSPTSIRCGRATGIFPLPPSRGHSHLTAVPVKAV